MKIHCPQCGKKYLVDASDMGLQTENHFVCHCCGHQFVGNYDRDQNSLRPALAMESEDWTALDLKNDKDGAASSRKEPLTHCPFCDGDLALVTADECPHCLKVPSKFVASGQKDPVVTASAQNESQALDQIPETVKTKLRGAWDEVIENFDAPEYHQEFLALSSKLGQLDYAEERYEKVLSVIGEDHEVLNRLQQIEMLRFQQRAMVGDPGLDEKLNDWRNKGFLIIVGSALLLVSTLSRDLRAFSFLGVALVVAIYLYSRRK